MRAGNTWQLKKAASIPNSPGYVRQTHPSQTCKLPTRFMTVLEMRNAREERNGTFNQKSLSFQKDVQCAAGVNNLRH